MRLKLWLAFAAFVLLSTTRWLAADWLSATQPTLIEQALQFAALTLLFALLSLRHLRSVRLRQLPLPAVLFFALPSIASAVAGGHVSAPTQVLVFTLLPFAVILAVAGQSASFGPEPETRRLLIPAVAGAFGALLLIPAAIPGTPLASIFFAVLLAADIAAALAAVRLHRVLAGAPILASATVVCAISAAVLVLCRRIGYASPTLANVIPQAILTLVLDAPILLLTLYLLREVAPIRFASRYLLIPLVAILEGLAASRPPMTLSLSAGVVLMAIGGATLLLAKD
jgi:drug/metabolite transporter (DMT)-like permease